LTIATPTAVAKLFSAFWHADAGWIAQGCSSTAGSTYCTWARPKHHLKIQVRNATAGLPLLVVAVQSTR
jgi:hypothetical protein